MNHCKQARNSLDALEQFVHEQQQNSLSKLDALAKRRGVVFSEQESNENTKFVVDRDERFLRIAREAVCNCKKEKLEGLLMEIRGLGHYFCVYCDDKNKLDRLADELYLNIHQ